MTIRFSGIVERLQRAMTASILACWFPSLRILTRRGMASEALMVGLLMDEAERVRRAAVAYSWRLEFVDCKK